MRLGSWPCVLAPGSLAREAYGVDQIHERHRHRYEFNNAYRKRSRIRAWSPPGSAPTARSSRSSSCRDHPWFVAVQFHPEFKSKPTKAHPLFRDFVAAALRQRETSRDWTAER